MTVTATATGRAAAEPGRHGGSPSATGPGQGRPWRGTQAESGSGHAAALRQSFTSISDSPAEWTGEDVPGRVAAGTQTLQGPVQIHTHYDAYLDRYMLMTDTC